MARGRLTAAVMVAAVLAVAAPALAAPAEVDETFGDDGVAVVALHEDDGFTFHVSDVAATEDGSTVLLGGVLRVDGLDGFVPEVDFDLALARLGPSGQLDPSFGEGGVSRFDAGGFDLPARLGLDSQGRILFSANNVDDAGTVHAIIGRATSDGVLDESFGVAGLAKATPAPVQYAGGLVVDDTDRPVVALVTADDAERDETADASVARLTVTGAPDPRFGTHGVTTVLAGSSGAFGLADSGDDGFVVSGLTDGLPFVARIDASGALDTSFADAGVARLPVDGGIAMVVEPAADGSLLVGGTVGARTGLLARLGPEGELDTAFGRDGLRTVRGADGGAMPVVSIAADPSGTVTFAAPQQGWSPRATVGRLLASGVEDGGFGGDGYVHPLDGAGFASSAATALAAGPQGTVLSAGTAGTDTDVSAFVARLRSIPPGTGVTSRHVRRVAGNDRVATAIALSRAAFVDAGVSTGRDANEVVLAAAGRFPDALVAAPYAAAANAPLLLNPQTSVDARVMDEIRRVLPDGGMVTLMGGVGVLGSDVESELRTAGYTVQRIAGADRYETSVRVADALGPRAVLLARGDAFPDALAAGPAAAEISGAVLLTDGARLPDVVAAHLDGNPELTVYAVGGQAASAAPAAEPIAGADRYATAARVADRFFHTPARTVVASGQRFPDALAGGTLASLTGSPLLLTMQRSLPAPTRQSLQGIRPFHRSVTVAGGTAVVDDSVLGAVGSATG